MSLIEQKFADELARLDAATVAVKEAVTVSKETVAELQEVIAQLRADAENSVPVAVLDELEAKLQDRATKLEEVVVPDAPTEPEEPVEEPSEPVDGEPTE